MVLNVKDVEHIPLGKAEDLTLLNFEHFRPLYRIKSKSTKTYWLCKCECGCIKQSKGSLTIERLLKDNNIQFIKEYKFDNCRNVKPLPFDFYLPDYNIIIEYDGEQHFIPKPHFDDIKYIHQNDIIKNIFCFNNKIYLIRVPYNYQDLKIEDLLYNSKFHITLENMDTYYKEGGYHDFN